MKILMCLLPMLLPLVAAAQWELEKDQDGIQVYTEEVKASDIRRFRAEITLPVSMDRVLAVFDDFKRYPEWKFKVSRSDVLKQPDEISWYHYQDISMPFPLSDRMFVLHSRLQPQGRDRVIIETRAVPDYCRNNTLEACKSINASGDLLVEEARGLHVLEQLADGSTRVTWTQHAEPGGALPDWLVNAMLVDGPWETFSNLRDYVNEPRYAEARLQRDESGVLLGGFEKVSW
jgi:hypothetical protein